MLGLRLKPLYVPIPCQVRLPRFPEILKPISLRKHVDFISNLFAKIKNILFCDQVPFQIRFKLHCTGESSLGHHFPRIAELEMHPKPSSKHIENIQSAASFDHLKGRAHDLVILSRTVCKLSRPGEWLRLSHTVRTQPLWLGSLLPLSHTIRGCGFEGNVKRSLSHTIRRSTS